MKIALFSPLNPVRSGIADYTEEMLPELQKHLEIDLYVEKGTVPSNTQISKQFAIKEFAPSAFPADRYAAILYHMGNSYRAHRYIYQALRQFPGIVVLHDYVLQGFYAEMLSATKKYDLFFQRLLETYPAAAQTIARHATDRLPLPIWESELGLRYPLNEEIVQYARALIVHSQFARNLLRQKTDKQVAHIPLHAAIPVAFDPGKVRSALGFAADDLLLCSTGYVTKTKRYEIIAAALAELQLPRLRWVIMGQDAANWLKVLLDGKEKKFLYKGFLPLAAMEMQVQASDICLNLRYPTMGESSASLLRQMSFAKPVLVSAAGSYAEFPDYCVLKTPCDVDEKEMIKRSVLALAGNRELRLAIGNEAREYAQGECSIARCCRLYREFIAQIAGSK